MGVDPYFDAVEHNGRVLEAPHEGKPGQVTPDQVDFPGLGVFPRRKWWRRRPPRRSPTENYVPGFQPRSFLHGLPSYIHTVHEEQYFTQFIIPIDREHLYSMCAMSGHYTTKKRRWWTFYYPIFSVTHDTIFVGQDHRVLREDDDRPRAPVGLGPGHHPLAEVRRGERPGLPRRPPRGCR